MTRLGMLLLVLVLLVVSGAAVSAYPTYDGHTGIVILPTAELAPQGSLDLALSFQNSTGGWDAWPARLVVGAGENAELWVGYTRWKDGYTEHIWNGGLKYRFLNQTEDDVDLALGASYANDDWKYDTTKITKAFLVASKNFPLDETGELSGRGTLGVIYSHFKESHWKDSFTKPYVALELLHNSGAALGMEYRWKDNDFDEKAAFSAVLRYKVPDNPLWFEVGTTNSEYWGYAWGKQRAFYGLGFTFESK